MLLLSRQSSGVPSTYDKYRWHWIARQSRHKHCVAGFRINALPFIKMLLHCIAKHQPIVVETRFVELKGTSDELGLKQFATRWNTQSRQCLFITTLAVWQVPSVWWAPQSTCHVTRQCDVITSSRRRSWKCHNDDDERDSEASSAVTELIRHLTFHK